MAKLYAGFLREAFNSSPAAKLGYLLSRRAIDNLRARTDPRRYNGAILLGLNGIVVKSHGGTDELGFANAVCVAIDLAASSEERRVGKGGGSTCRSRWSPYPSKKNKKQQN